MSEKGKAFREMRINAVQNGFIARPSLQEYEGRGVSECFVFSTVEQLAAWMLAQKWQMADPE